MAKILVVDDEPHLTLVLALWLEKRGHNVTRADNGAAALALLRSQAFDVLVTDVDMPHMNGLTLIGNTDVIDQLRGVIVLTRRCDHNELVSLRGRCHIQFIPKPFSPTGIVQMVEEIMSPGPCITAP